MTDALADPDHDGYINRHGGDVVSIIASYQPIMISRVRWAAIAEFTRSAATDFSPRHEDEARNVLFGIARLADWTHHTAGHPLRREIVLDPRNIDDFIKRGYPVAERSRKSSVRNYLHILSAELGHGDEARRRARKKVTVDRYAPYTPAEYANFRLTGKTVSTDHRQHVWSTALALGAGFGLITPELFEVRPDDLVEDERGLILTVRGRTVTCLPEWEREVLAAVGRRPDDAWLLVDELPSDPATFLHNLLRLAATTAHQDRFVVERLRTTWIVRHLEAGTPVQAILRGLGATTTKSIERCLRYVDPIDDSAYFTALHLGGEK